jgi:hypothetical protein
MCESLTKSLERTRAAMNVRGEFEAFLALPVVAQFRR